METPLTAAAPASARMPSLMRLALPGLFLPGSFILFGLGAVVLQPFLSLLLSSSAVEAAQLPVMGVALIAGGALWGRALGLDFAVGIRRRMALAAALSHIALVLLAGVVLGRLEEDLVGAGHSPLPLHQLFTALFVPATAIVCAGMSAAVGLAAGGRRLAGRLAWRGALAGAAAFLIANVIQDLLGRRVGGPNAAETATMISVMFIANTCAALAMTAAIARALRAARPE